MTDTSTPTAPRPAAPPVVEVTIRRAGPADAATVAMLLHELARHEDSLDAVRADTADWRRLLAHPAVAVLLAFVGDHPVGYVSGVRQLNLWVGRDLFALDDLYVRPEARDRGVGGRLMASVAELVAPEGLLVTWGVREDNEAGQRFYRRLGATLRTKMVAAWQPAAYADHLESLRRP